MLLLVNLYYGPRAIYGSGDFILTGLTCEVSTAGGASGFRPALFLPEKEASFH